MKKLIMALQLAALFVVPAVTHSAVPDSRYHYYTTPQVRQIIHKIFTRFPDAADRVAYCESQYNQFDIGSAGEIGNFQIHPVHFWQYAGTTPMAIRFGKINPNRLMDPVYNARVAWYLSHGGADFGIWTCGYRAFHGSSHVV